MALVTATSHAQELTVDAIGRKLEEKDARLRASAALTLGGVKGDEVPKAVALLCKAIGDENVLVRQSVASGLKRLHDRAALDCLRSRRNVEDVDDVKLQITRAIEAIEAESAPAPTAPTNNANAKYYVAVAVANNTGRADVEPMVHSSARGKLDAAGPFQLAPMKESNAEAKQAIAKRKLKGFYLSCSVDSFTYTDDPNNGLMVKAKVKVAVFSYPERNLKGELGPKTVSVSASRRGDKSAEDQAVQVAVVSIMNQFANNVGMFP
jgi:hypothetical protein